MKLLVLYNDFEDYVLYINGKQYQDIDYRWAECMVWLSDTIAGFDVEFKEVNLQRTEYPNII
jgi:hypothetical protein